MKRVLNYTYKVYDGKDLLLVTPILANARELVYEKWEDDKLAFNYGTLTIKGYRVDKIRTSELGKKKRAKQKFIGPFLPFNYSNPPGPDVIGYYYNKNRKKQLEKL